MLDLGTNGQERLSEIVAVLCHQCKELNGEPMKVTFTDRMVFNNSRDEEAGGQPGVDVNLDFLPHPKPQSAKGMCGILSKSKTGATILYSRRGQ